jgi:hypothetical protein
MLYTQNCTTCNKELKYYIDFNLEDQYDIPPYAYGYPAVNIDNSQSTVLPHDIVLFMKKECILEGRPDYIVQTYDYFMSCSRTCTITDKNKNKILNFLKRTGDLVMLYYNSNYIRLMDQYITEHNDSDLKYTQEPHLHPINNSSTLFDLLTKFNMLT